jgi:hypothetical protein
LSLHVAHLLVGFLESKPWDNGRHTSAIRPTAENVWVVRIIEISNQRQGRHHVERRVHC